MNHDRNKDNQSVRQTKMRPFMDNRDICHIKIETSTKNKTSKTRHAGRKRNFVAKRPLSKSMSELKIKSSKSRQAQNGKDYNKKRPTEGRGKRKP